MQTFYTETLYEIITILEQKIKPLEPQEITRFKVLNPDTKSNLYNGEYVDNNNKKYIYRGYKTWIDLAHMLKCKMLTPVVEDKNLIIISYQKLNTEKSFHNQQNDTEQKYGNNSIFSQINKNEEAGFLYYYQQSLKNIDLKKRYKILNLGINNAHEFESLLQIDKDFDKKELVGIDYCSSAIKEAKNKFAKHNNVKFYTHDINDLHSLNLGKFDLIITIGTLQSSNIKFNATFMSIVQNYLKKDGAMIIGFVNCRWIDTQMIYGAKVKNYPFSELGLLYKDVMFCKKYLQQKQYRVTITGKDYIFLSATSIQKTDKSQ